MEQKSVYVELVPVEVGIPVEMFKKTLKRQRRFNRAITAFAVLSTICLLSQDKHIEKLTNKLRKLKQAERD